MIASEWSWVLGIPVLVPFAAAAIALLLGRRATAQRVVSLVALCIVQLDAFFIAYLSAEGPFTLDVGGWSAPVGITLVADRLSAMMLVVSVFVTICVLIYSFTQDPAEGRRLPVAVFQPTFLILSAGVSNAFLTGDLFNLYVGFEILLVASFVLITLGGSRERIRSGTVYVVVSVVSSSIFLIALAMVYGAVGTVNMAQIAIRMDGIDPATAQLIEVMLLVAFGVKAAVFPLSAWLPDSYPTAPAPVTAVFAGLLTKVGIYAIIRTQSTIFADTGLNKALMVIALATMITGILGAVAQDDIKRLLSFTLVSHIGFMLWGVGIGSIDGLSAAIFYTAHHIIVQTALFLVSGLMEQVGGTTSLAKLGSLLKVWPFLAVVYLIPALNLAGIPPLSGFLGKIGLIEASAAVGSPLNWTLIAGGLVTSLLTLYALLRAWNMAFWQPAEDEITKRPVAWTMTFSTVLLVAASVLLAVLAGPIYQYAAGSATELREQEPYIQAVLPDSERGTGQSHEESDDHGESDGEQTPAVMPPIATPAPSADASSDGPTSAPVSGTPTVGEPSQSAGER
ncbi:Na+/H+ antiporter subunit D [Propionimicrobium sp. PCR01-08-3]|uniref:Na+/H+ antiporter subunit D n=1 Tax=Propionimicrobium sp. PCR01-08-3 TaxID=3052086 RepID=UPI00255C5A80|nr:Na+/H+ antiporter subunit D [Propionimicrobium sp. PCR01-08-3]WIY82762.1 Na+/H+ antiporter subunit D [Propionimicrobium sp. PCR01-08-3]